MLKYDLKKIPEEYSPELIDLISKTISGDWTTRPKCNDLLKDKHFLKYLDNQYFGEIDNDMYNGKGNLLFK